MFYFIIKRMVMIKGEMNEGFYPKIAVYANE